jgi:hypothetical protein
VRPSNRVERSRTLVFLIHSASIIAAYCNDDDYEQQIVQALRQLVDGTQGARELIMMDVVFVAGTAAFFVIAIAYVRGCVHL